MDCSSYSLQYRSMVHLLNYSKILYNTHRRNNSNFGNKSNFPFSHNICKISYVYIPPFSKNGIFFVNSDVSHNWLSVHNLTLKKLATQSTFVSEKCGDLQWGVSICPSYKMLFGSQVVCSKMLSEHTSNLHACML